MSKNINTTNEKKKTYNNKNPKITPRDQLLQICDIFLNKADPSNQSEIEVRFGTKGIKYLNKLDYDNVIKKMKSMGFTNISSEGSYSLKIDPEFLDLRTGEFKQSNIRIEIDGLNAIQEYCKTNDISNILQNITFRKKGPIFIKDERVPSADFDDFNFRVSYANEEIINKNSKLAKDISDNWLKTKKSFRYINRVSFIRNDLPFRIDLSIVKSSTRQNGRLVKTFNTTDSNVFNNTETYDIEIELLNLDAKMLYKKPEEMVKGIDQITKYVLSGLQSTNYPISYKEQKEVLQEYMKTIHKEDYNKRIYPSDFIGPSSKTLQIKHIVPVNPNINAPNIRDNYVVTEKADGDRALLFVNQQGRIYLITTNMSVIFTGAKSPNKDYYNSILDGELILHNKNGKFINLYAAFDIYFVKGEDIRSYGFLKTEIESDKQMQKLRLPILRKVISELAVESIIKNKTSVNSNTDSNNISISPIKVTSKKFYPIINKESNKLDNMSIFDACNYIMRNIDDDLFEYNTDGLIFTPISFGVGSDKIGKAGPLKKITWEYSFKWKPAEFNTVDFLITTKKNADGSDVITPIFENGLNTSLISQFAQYKTLVLRCGFSESKHGYINPCQDILDDKLPSVSNQENEDSYKPVQFFPTDPYDPSAGLSNIMLEEDENNNFQMFTEEREVFEDNTIIEFRYDLSRSGLWRWIPLRVRYDKTSEYRQGLSNYGNAYNVANDNWYSIHNPITKAMISTGENIPDEINESDVYYNRISNSNDTKGLRDFHNLFVKKILIQSVSNRGDTLIDFACGKAGDLPKWINANLSFVLGIDISKDNLENRLNGACARFLNYKKEFKTMPYALFVNGNSCLNIRSGEALLNEKAVQITKAVFGKGPKEKLGSGVVRQYGKGEEGFNISSCQFAIHYMFENVKVLHNFLRNVAECTKLGGYFIGTCYDGKTIFSKLSKKQQGESIDIYEKGKKIWQLVKDYSSSQLPDNESCIGYKIDVYQESINQLIPEYLVNFDYLNQIMEDYGFVRMNMEDSKKLGLPESSGMFIELYNLMMNEIARYPSKKNEYGQGPYMNAYEKEISFLNRYFVYKKIRTVNAEKIAESFISYLPEELEFEKVETKKSMIAVEKANKNKPRVKKLNKTLVLVEATEALEEKQSPLQLPEEQEEQEEQEEKEEKELVLELKPLKGKEKDKEKGKKKTSRKKLENFSIEE